MPAVQRGGAKAAHLNGTGEGVGTRGSERTAVQHMALWMPLGMSMKMSRMPIPPPSCYSPSGLLSSERGVNFRSTKGCGDGPRTRHTV